MHRRKSCLFVQMSTCQGGYKVEEMYGHHLYAKVYMTLVETSETKMTDARTRTPRVTASTCTQRKGYVIYLLAWLDWVFY